MQEFIDRSNLESISKNFFGTAPFEILKLKGDASDRRIYRIVHKTDSVIGVCGNNRAENDAFIGFTEHFKSFQLPVPDVYLYDAEKKVYLLKDLGDVTLADYKKSLNAGIESKHIVKCYEKVIEYLIEFQITAGKSINYDFCYQHKNFDTTAILWDFLYFKNRFMQYFYKKKVNFDYLYKDLKQLAEWLSKCNRTYFLYRDFQSRNIMLFNNNFYFIDYQSGRRGALQYDLASLLIDAKNGLEKQNREHFINYYLKRTQSKIQINKEEFTEYFYGFALARILQALGAFGFLSQVKAQKHFETYIPIALKNLSLLIKHIPILAQLSTLNSTLNSLIEQTEYV